MNRARAPKLDESNSALYRPVPTSKRAVLCWEPATYELSWGTQRFDQPHMRVDDGDQPYGVELRTFFATHKAVPDKPDHYIKDAPVRALQVREDTDIVTVIDGREEMKATVKAGAWIVQNPAGEQYYNTDDEFQRRYELLS